MQQVASERRVESRHRLHIWAVVRRYGSQTAEKIILADLSCGGFKMRSAAKFAVNDMFAVELADRTTAATVVRRDPALPEYGCRFLHPLAPTVVKGIVDQAQPPHNVAAKPTPCSS